EFGFGGVYYQHPVSGHTPCKVSGAEFYGNAEMQYGTRILTDKHGFFNAKSPGRKDARTQGRRVLFGFLCGSAAQRLRVNFLPRGQWIMLNAERQKIQRKGIEF
ncbi:MAG: hypothetical protein U9R05_06970, partial [Chloroflexota bacterium]|nr:hypothetical protein [Chloroflexota bacterium]